MSKGRSLTRKAIYDRLRQAACDSNPVAGLTHGFYRYPARFSPVFAGAAVDCLSEPGDLVLDPYMGGGTTVVEAMARGRDVVGNDLNSLASFVATAKTTLLGHTERFAVSHWAREIVPTLNYRHSSDAMAQQLETEKTRNLSLPRGRFLKKLLAAILCSIDEQLPDGPAQAFARCATLQVAQWALDGRMTHTSLAQFRARLTESLLGMLSDLQKMEQAVQGAGRVPRVYLSNTDAAELPALPVFRDEGQVVNLVVTSPPYPGVHVLYHRWQVDGRRETPAPYWIAGCSDGQGASYYNFADRRPEAEDRYFEVSLRTLRAARQVMANGALFVQMVAFGQPDTQLPRYLANMEAAGFREMVLGRERIWRSVPNRRWHAVTKGNTNGANEVVLVHQAI